MKNGADVFWVELKNRPFSQPFYALIKMSSRIALFISSLLLLLTVLFFPRWEKPHTEAPIAWDVSGYYLYLPATFIYDDLYELKFLPEIIEKYKPTPNINQAYSAGNGNMVMKYPAGLSILYTPLFFIAHISAKTLDYPADGFSLPYQIAIQLGGVLFAIIGLIFLRKILLQYFPDRTAGGLIILIALGTNFFNYATFDSANVHIWSFTLLSILTHQTMHWHHLATWPRALGIGACVGLAALVRPTEIIFAIVPILWGINNWESKLLFFKNHYPQIIGAVLFTLAIGSIQFFYWKSATGNWVVYSYQDQGFYWTRPHFIDVFFSYRKGWLIYTPLMLFALLGFAFWLGKWKKNIPPYMLPIICFFMVNTWIISSWDIWWYGGSFGQRAMIPSYVLLAFPLAHLINWIKIKPWRAIIFTPLFLACISLNLFQTYQAHWGPWEATYMNQAYYWRIFFKTDDNPYDKILLDTNVGFGGKKKKDISVFKPDLSDPNDTLGLTKKISRSGNYVLNGR